jgi:hypothetical protein
MKKFAIALRVTIARTASVAAVVVCWVKSRSLSSLTRTTSNGTTAQWFRRFPLTREYSLYNIIIITLSAFTLAVFLQDQAANPGENVPT